MRVTLTFRHTGGIHVVTGESGPRRYSHDLFLRIADELRQQAEAQIGGSVTLVRSLVADIVHQKAAA